MCDDRDAVSFDLGLICTRRSKRDRQQGAVTLFGMRLFRRFICGGRGPSSAVSAVIGGCDVSPV